MAEEQSRAAEYLSQAARMRQLARDTRYPEVRTRLLWMTALSSGWRIRSKNGAKRCGPPPIRSLQRNVSAMMAAIRPNVASQLTAPIKFSIMR